MVNINSLILGLTAVSNSPSFSKYYNGAPFPTDVATPTFVYPSLNFPSTHSCSEPSSGPLFSASPPGSVSYGGYGTSNYGSTSNQKPFPQESLEQYNVLRSLGGTGPFISNSGFGTSVDTPDQCSIDQVHLYMRHGERFPTTGTGASLQALFAKLKAANVTDSKGPLAFIEDLEYFVPNPAYYEYESYSGFYSGLADAFNLGSIMREKYQPLRDSETVLLVFTSGQQRVVDTARSFARGFFNSNYSSLASIQVLPEIATRGANTLTSRDACVNYNGSFNNDIINSFSSDYLTVEANRLNKLSPGYNITGADVYNMLGYCGFELNVKGNSHFCRSISNDALINFAYSKDLSYYYSNGPGYNLSTPMGNVIANATATLLEEGPESGSLFFSFSHDDDLMTYVSALGLFKNNPELPTDEIEFGRTFKSSEIVPMGGRLVTERLSCFNSTINTQDIFVRTILNDSVFPIAGCSDGPGFSCPLTGCRLLQLLGENSTFLIVI